MPLYSDLNDECLLTLMNGGDELAFSAIYSRYWKRLIALAYRHMKDKFEAEEIVQEIFVSFWHRKENLKITSLSSYFGTAVKFSVFKKVLRDGRRSEIIKDTFGKDSFDVADEIIHTKFLEEFINGIVEQLPEKTKIVYQLSRKQGFSNKEIASTLQIAEKTVESHVTKALKVLRFNLKEIMILLITAKFLK